MKKLFLTLVVILTTTIAFAQSNYQDVVYLKNGNIIRGVITEQIPDVSLKIETPSGSVFVYKIDEVEKITKERITTPQTQSVPTTPSQSSTSNYENTSTTPPNGMTLSRFESMSSREIDSWLATNEHSNIYENFHKGVKLRKAGTGLLISGLVVGGAGLITMIAGASSGTWTEVNRPDFVGYVGTGGDGPTIVAGAALFAIGTATTIVSIPLRVSGRKRKNRAKDEYINQYLRYPSTSYNPSFEFGITSNGVGLTMNF
jgi:hypothetical protein